MLEKKYIAELGDWQGFEVGTVGRRQPEDGVERPKIWVELFPDRTQPMKCSGCSQEVGRLWPVLEEYSIEDILKSIKLPVARKAVVKWSGTHR